VGAGGAPGGGAGTAGPSPERAVGDARILDRGYRRYDGPRLGQAAALRSLAVHSLRRVLGLRRPARAKALPVIVAVIAYVPAVVIVGIAAFVQDAFRDDLPTYAGYYGFVFTAILLFVTFVAPEALCPDRRSRLLGQYLAGPVSRAGYLVAKAASVVTVLLLVTLGPPLVLLVALSLESAGPDGVGEFLATLGRITASGLVLSAILGALALAVASLTDRKAFASVGIIVFLTVTSIAANVLYEGGDGVEWAGVFSLTQLPVEVVLRIFAVPAECPRFGSCDDELIFPELSTFAVFGAAALWVVAAVAVLWSRYRRVEAS
jgi:ABC-2 type transport system permease protein